MAAFGLKNIIGKISGREFLLKRLEPFDRSDATVLLWLLAIWAAFVFPAIALRSFFFEEGYVVGVARAAIEDSNWLVPHLYGWRFVERPNLMAWIVAVAGMAFGGINQWIARAPTVLSLLGGCLMVFYLVRRHTGALAALFGALCVLVSPIILQKVYVAEPDVLVSVILFGTFMIWWNGVEAAGIGVLRWLGICFLLVLAVLVKGPQPIAYFGIGAAAYHLCLRQWRDLCALALVGLAASSVAASWYWAVYIPGDLSSWLWHSRIGFKPSIAQYLASRISFTAVLTLELLPAMLLAIPLAWSVLRKRIGKNDELVFALLLYAFCTSIILALWPGGRPRYAMPAIFAVAAIAGLAFERFRVARPNLVNAAVLVGAALGAYQIVLSWLVMPAFSELFQRTRIAAGVITTVMGNSSATLYANSETRDTGVFAYMRKPLRIVPFDDLQRLQAPVWILVGAEYERRFREAHPDADIGTHVILSTDEKHHLLELRKR